MGRLLCFLGFHAWQMKNEWGHWMDVVLPLRNFDAELKCERCEKKKWFYAKHPDMGPIEIHEKDGSAEIRFPKESK